MNELFKPEESRKLLLRILEDHAEVDLKIVARIFIEQKIIRDLIEKKHYHEEDAKREGRRLQLEIEKILLSFATELEKQGKLKLNINDMKVFRSA